jgi:hypothetical protein
MLCNVVAVVLPSAIIESLQMWSALQHYGYHIAVCPFVRPTSIRHGSIPFANIHP